LAVLLSRLARESTEKHARIVVREVLALGAFGLRGAVVSSRRGRCKCVQPLDRAVRIAIDARRRSHAAER
jgi:hypothetical protein